MSIFCQDLTLISLLQTYTHTHTTQTAVDYLRSLMNNFNKYSWRIVGQWLETVGTPILELTAKSPLRGQDVHHAPQ